jgi:hypothetical protein
MKYNTPDWWRRIVKELRKLNVEPRSRKEAKKVKD